MTLENPPMDLEALEAMLRREGAAGIPPYASDGLASIAHGGPEVVAWLEKAVADKGDLAFLALEGLRIHFPNVADRVAPERGAAIYAENLASSHWFNSWGLPGHAPTDTAQALIDIGEAAIPKLVPLLDDAREARSFGSEEAAMSRMLGYRVCDYALWLISAIEGRALAFPQSIEQRDRSIQATKGVTR